MLWPANILRNVGRCTTVKKTWSKIKIKYAFYACVCFGSSSARYVVYRLSFVWFRFSFILVSPSVCVYVYEHFHAAFAIADILQRRRKLYTIALQYTHSVYFSREFVVVGELLWIYKQC